MTDSTKYNITDSISVETLAKEVNVSPDRLLKQFAEAGIKIIKATDVVTEAQKKTLLAYLTKHRGHSSPNNTHQNNIVLRRQKTSKLIISNASNTKTIITRKRKIYISPLEEGAVIQDGNQNTAASATLDQKKIDLPQPQLTPGHPSSPGHTNLSVPFDETSQSIPTSIEKSKIYATALSSQDIASSPAIAPSEKIASENNQSPLTSKTNQEITANKEEEKNLFHKEKRIPSKEAENTKGRYKKKKNRNQRSDDPLSLLKGGLKSGIDISMVLSPEEEEANLAASAAKKQKEEKNTTLPVKNTPLNTKIEIHAFTKPKTPIIRQITVPKSILVSDLAQRLSIKSKLIIKKLMELGLSVTASQTIDQDIAMLIVEEMGHCAHSMQENDLESTLLKTLQGNNLPKQSRPPIVTIMGHVDHGKTTLLDYIRATTIATGEAGGITQHIGAYRIQTDKGIITFLDTPGHAAFTAMRARGAMLTDIVVLVVAADDGVMPQTIEAIEHAKAAHVPIIVAINKMDKLITDLDRLQAELSKHGLVVESWGGETMCVPISAKTGMGIDALLEAILLQADLLELKAPISGPSSGIVIEARLDRGRGTIISVLVQQGILHKGDFILAGQECGRIRALFDEKSQSIEAAGPSTPAELLGFTNIPTAGEPFIVISDEKQARTIAESRKNKKREQALSYKTPTANDLFQQIAQQKKSIMVLNIVLKADVQGSAEALRQALQQLSNDRVNVHVIASGIGGINESDVYLAMASNASLVGFNVRATGSAQALITANHLIVHYHTVIYEIIRLIKQSINGSLKAIIQEHTLGLAEIRSLFRSSKTGAIAGCIVLEGILKRHQPMRILRNSTIIFEGVLDSLRRFKEDVNEVRAGTECGIAVKHYHDVKIGDQVEVFEKIAIKQEI